MTSRYVCIWFPQLAIDWLIIRRLVLMHVPFVLTAPNHGRLLITAASANAYSKGIGIGMAMADARAIVPSLQVFDDRPGLHGKLLKGIGEWCVRYTPFTAIDLPDGLILDCSGCTHLWGGEEKYLEDIVNRLKERGYNIHAAIASTIGAAWAISRFGKTNSIIECGGEVEALLSLPPAALRLEPLILERLQKLGFNKISGFLNIPRQALRRRFGKDLLLRIDQALGIEKEGVEPLQAIEPYQERLPCLEPISTATGIEIAIKQLLETLCHRLRQESKGLRSAVFKGYRIDGKIESIEIGTNRPSHNVDHLFKLFELKICNIEPALGIELFILEAPVVEEAPSSQEMLWGGTGSLNDVGVAELLDRLTGRTGPNTIHRYLPDEHYWPERSVKPASYINEKPATHWQPEKRRPIQLLAKPQPVEVAAPIPDYPPMNFRYNGKLHKIKKADGPERIEPEWWIEGGEHRDYYCVEDEEGCRYWLFRLGHYAGDKSHSWFIHGFFA